MAVSRLTLFGVAMENVSVINIVKKAASLIIFRQLRYHFRTVGFI